MIYSSFRLRGFYIFSWIFMALLFYTARILNNDIIVSTMYIIVLEELSDDPAAKGESDRQDDERFRIMSDRLQLATNSIINCVLQKLPARPEILRI